MYKKLNSQLIDWDFNFFIVLSSSEKFTIPNKTNQTITDTVYLPNTIFNNYYG